MGSPLGPTLANIIMTEFEDIIIKPLINSGTIKFYKRYVDNTLILTKPSDIPYIFAKFNSFHPSIYTQLTISMTTTSIFSTSKFTPLVFLSTENLRILVNINTSLVFHLGHEKLLGYELLPTVLTKFAVMKHS